MAKKTGQFQPGNKAAVGSLNNGHPRTVSPNDEGLIKLGEEMVEFCKKNEPLHLSDFYTLEKGIIYKTWKTYIQRSVFIPYYEQALKIVAKHYINGTIAPPIAQRFIRIYYRDVKDEEDDIIQIKLDKELQHKKDLIDHELARKAETGINVPAEMLDKFADIMRAMSNSQSDRNNSRNNTIKE